MNIKIGKYDLFFSAEAQHILDVHIQRGSNDPERGGIILGKLIDGKVHVLKLSVPTELDKASRMNFERHRISAQIIINYEFLNSNRQITYFGEWHTHPEDIPSPSGTDMKMIRKQFADNLINTDFLILLIQGRKSLFIGIYDKFGFNSVNVPNH